MSSLALELPLELHSAVRDSLVLARATWPKLLVSDAQFAASIAKHLPPNAGPEEVARLHAADLYLACGCGHGDSRALAEFETHYSADIQVLLRRVRGASDLLDETQQVLRSHLFVANSGGSARILEYAGRGPLLAFLRVVGVRLALQLVRKTKAEQVDDELWDMPSDQDDPGLQYLKELYRKEFKAAFAQALGALSARDRTLLRYHLVEKLTIEQLAAIDDTPRSSAARHLATARRRLIEGTQQAMAGRLKLEGNELDSVMRLVQSNADVSVSRLLKP